MTANLIASAHAYIDAERRYWTAREIFETTGSPTDERTMNDADHDAHLASDAVRIDGGTIEDTHIISPTGHILATV